MNEKIKNLIEELMIICHDENIGLAVTAVDEQEEIIKAEAGPAKLVVTGVLEQYKWAQDELAKTSCDCAECTKLKHQFGVADGISADHTFVIDNEEDLADVMTRILKGEFQ
ncbi:hypothetical protein N8A33_000459 [Enterococcus hirae]|uniref:hypothetical protein n=1 Tax=Enterococcus hirae TaxID=1354 RepID=UPI00195986A0|nr:hypothetical protein [Enterococcus hirae]EMF0150678.1 hypothetical protein [Enterococcus hirae]EMF0532938.1 hypothetical protein [Enterococcus hirae]VTX52974.1 Uncharacterised protein [Enterococcus hirae]